MEKKKFDFKDYARMLKDVVSIILLRIILYGFLTGLFAIVIWVLISGMNG